MRQSKFTETQIVSILKEADAGCTVNEIWRQYGISRHLRRYERRWLVERFFAWLQWKRRLWCAGNTTPRTSLGLCSSPASPCSSNNFEIDSNIASLVVIHPLP